MCLSATCSVVVADDVITTTGDIQVVSLVDDLPAEALTALADVAEDPPAKPEPVLTPAEMLAAAQSRVDEAQDAVDNLAADATTEETIAAYGELTVAQRELTAAENLPENQPPPTAAAILLAAQSRLVDAQEAVDNLDADDATPDQTGAAYKELAAAKQALTVAENLPDNIAASLPVPLTPLEVAQEAAQDAATLAETAATTAEAAATEAKGKAADRARFQTIVPSSYKHAHSSQTHADLARTDADNAKAAAAEAVADAATLSDAIRAQQKAEDLKKSAESHQKMAEDSRNDALAVAATEVFVGEDDGDTTYRVGTTTIVLDGEERSNTVGDVTRETGRRGNIIETKTFAAVEAVMPMPNEDTPVAEVVGLPMRVADIDLGEMYDSLEDNARLWLIDAYAGTTTVNLFLRNPGDDGVPNAAAIEIRPGTATTIDTDMMTTNDEMVPYVRLTSATGVFLLRTSAGDAVTVTVPPVEATPANVPRKIFYYRPMVDGDNDAATPATPVTADDPDTAMDDSLVFVEQSVLVGAEIAGVTTYEYNQVAVTLGVDFPETTAFEYISYGIWTSLDEETGNDLAALGIGFVDGGDNMTAVGDMPNIGTLTYDGNWVATVQAADGEGNGDITSPSNTASIVADFEDGDITVNLDMLAELTGDITDNTFMGTEATTVATPMGRVAGGEDFTGNFHGGFFGDRAAEAGGVFDFRSEDDKDGGFTGAFGGAR